MRAERHLAAAAERCQHRALGRHGAAGGRQIQLAQQPTHAQVVGAYLDRQRTLPDRGHQRFHGQIFRDMPFQAQPLHSSRRQNGRVGTVNGKRLAQAGIHIAADLHDAQVWPQVQELRAPAQAARRDHRARRQRHEPQAGARDQGVARILSHRDRRQRQPLGECARQVFQAMNRRVDAALGICQGNVLHRVNRHIQRAGEQRALQLGHEESLVAELRQRQVLRLRAVALCPHRLDHIARAGRTLAQTVEHPIGLPDGQW